MVLNLVLIGIAVALDPLPLTAFMIILPSKGGVRKGAAFVFGWLASLAIVVAVTVLATGNSPPEPSTAPSLAALAVKGAIGAVLVVIAVGLIRSEGSGPSRPRGCPAGTVHAVGRHTPRARLGGPRELRVMLTAGAATVVDAKLSSWESYIALFVFCVLGSAPYLALEIYTVLRPDHSRALLARFRTWIDTHTDQVIIIGSLILGFWLIGNSIYLVVT